MPSGQSVTIFSCRIPCAIAGAGKLKVAPAANDPAPARISRRLMAASLLPDDVKVPNGYGMASKTHSIKRSDYNFDLPTGINFRCGVTNRRTPPRPVLVRSTSVSGTRPRPQTLRVVP